MKPVPFMLATFLGKFIQFLLWSLLLIWFGPTISHTAKQAIHRHLDLVLSVAGFALLMLALYVARRIFDRRKGLMLPVEEEQ